MLSFTLHQSPLAAEVMVAVFGSAAVSSHPDRLEARGQWRGMRVRMNVATDARDEHTAPFTTIDLEEDIDVAASTTGEGASYVPHEMAIAFAPPSLYTVALVGAPQTLLESIARGPIAHRLAVNGLDHLSIGADAQREGCKTRGVRLVVEGWPTDEATLVRLLDSVVAIGAEAQADLAARGASRHPEVVAYESARVASRTQQGLAIVAGVVAGLSVVAAGVMLALH